MSDIDPKLLDEIDEYLSERLSGDPLDDFEERLLSDAALQTEVTQQIAFREALKSETTLLLSEPERNLLSRLHDWLISPAWAYASTSALALLVLVFLGGLEIGTTQLSQPGVLRYVELTRSGTDSVVRAPADKTIVLSIDAYGIGATRASFILSFKGKVIAEIPALEPDENQLFNLVVGPLEPGHYAAQLLKQDGESIDLSLIVGEDWKADP